MTRFRRRAATCLSAVLLAGALAACAGDDGAVESSEEQAPNAAAATILDFEFRPRTVAIDAGTTVTWTNEDDSPHSVRPDDGGFAESPAMTQGQTFSHTYASSGTFPYVCGIHNYMTGTVVVNGS